MNATSKIDAFWIRLFTGILILSLVPQKIKAQNENLGISRDDPVKIQRIDSTVILDGLSNEAAWEDIEPFSLTMHRPVYGKGPTEKSRMLIGYDDNYLYAAARFYDSNPEKIYAPYKKRDQLTRASDNLILGFDTFNDNENALMFYVTPTGNRTDAAMAGDAVGKQPNNDHWNTFWDAEAVTNDKGWFAEVRIPISSLKFEEDSDKVIMGMVAGRNLARNSEMDLYPAIPNKWGFWSFAKPSQMQDVYFEDIESKRPLYITPYVLGGLGRSFSLNDPATKYLKEDEMVGDIGLDVKYGLTNNLTLDVTVNTDFAQVEADAQQVNLTRYSLYFPENRRFFQERASTFEFNFGRNNRLFHSRRIGIHQGKEVRIYGGARMVGRIDDWDVGLLNMQTEKTSRLPSENFSVLRLRKKVINSGSYIGAIATSRIGMNNTWNTAYGLDGIFRILEGNELRYNWAQTFDDAANNEFLSLDPARIRLNLKNPSLEGLGYDLDYSRAGKDYQPGIGYERRENFTRFGNEIRYGWKVDEESKLLRHYTFMEGFTYLRNSDGTTESSEAGFGWSFNTKKGYGYELAVKRYAEDVEAAFDLSADTRIPAGRYTFYGLEGSFNTPLAKLTNFRSEMKAGSFYDGRRFSVTMMPTTNISSALELSLMYQWNKIDFPNREQNFSPHLARLRTLLTFDTEHSISAFIQYNSLTNKIYTNIRYRFNPRQGNDLYIVYNDGLNTSRYRQVPALPVSSRRTVMLKYTYTFNIQH